MAYYPMDETKNPTRTLRQGLTQLRDGLYRLKWTLDAMNQMTDAQIAAAYGFADSTVAAAAKAELASDIGKLLTDASQTNVNAATQQMLSQFA